MPGFPSAGVTEPAQGTHVYALVTDCPGQKTGTTPVDTCQKSLTTDGFQESKLWFYYIIKKLCM